MSLGAGASNQAAGRRYPWQPSKRPLPKAPSLWTNQWNYLPNPTLLIEGREGQNVEIKQAIDLWHRPASKQMWSRPRQAPAKGLRATPKQQKGVTADQHCLKFNLA